jgi:serine protease AprX
MNRSVEGVRSFRNLSIVTSAMAMAVALLAAPSAAAPEVQVIVGLADAAPVDAVALTEGVGGDYLQSLDIINGFSARVPADRVDTLRTHPAVAAVVADGSLEILEDGWENASSVALTDLGTYPGAMGSITEKTVFAEKFWANGYIGQGIDVALIDSGVVPVPGLSVSGKIINGPDLSFESQSDDLRYLDTYGHGTHLAGIIAGDDGTGGFKGVAPGARVVNVKVANYEGAVDVSQVIAAIDWVVQHRNDNGMNIRVINLAYGTDSTQPALLDPLSFAVEQAWRAGIVVVVAAGNDGNSHGLRNPAVNPYVIAVGASDSNGTEKPKDDFVTNFTNCGSSARYVDVFAPGRSIVSLRNPGSFADVNYPEARIGSAYFLGSGTSQASAVVSGAAALILSKYPAATPDEIKAYLMASGSPLETESKYCSVAHMINLEPLAVDKHLAELRVRLQSTKQYSLGTGTLEGARGSHHVAVDGVVLEGEQDIFGQKWNGEYWAKLAANHMAWDGGDWNGSTWAGTSWSGTSWSGTSWSGTSWSGTSWSGTSWSEYVWGSSSWTGTSWSGTSWSGTSWSGTSWSGTSWSDSGWLGLSWGRTSSFL